MFVDRLATPSSSFPYRARKTSLSVFIQHIMLTFLLVAVYPMLNIFPFFLLLAVEFDDCAGNEDVKFEVSDPSFYVDADLNLVPQQEVLHSRPLLLIHGLSAHADDMAQVEVTGLPGRLTRTLRVSNFCCLWCVLVNVCDYGHMVRLCFVFLSNQFVYFTTESKLKRLRFIKV